MTAFFKGRSIRKSGGRCLFYGIQCKSLSGNNVGCSPLFQRIDDQIKLDGSVKDIFGSFCTFDDVVTELKGTLLQPDDKRKDVLIRIGQQLEEVVL